MNKSFDSLQDATSLWVEETKVLVYEVVTAETYEYLNEIISIATIVVAMIGIVGNAVNINVFIRMGIDDGVTLTFLFLSVSDFSFTLVACIQNAALLLATLEKRYNFVFRTDPFAVGFFAANVFWGMYLVTILTTTYLALVRCLCIAKPFHFKNMFTKFRSQLILATFPIIGIGSQIPILANMGMTSTFDPRHNSTRKVLWLSSERERVKDGVRAIFEPILIVTCEVTVIVCVVVMAAKLKSSVRFRQKQEVADETSDLKLKGKERSVLVQVLVISVAFVFCNSLKIFHSMFALHPKYDMGRPYQYLYIIMSKSTTLSDVVNSSLNTYVYLTFNSKFRTVCFSCKKV